MIILNHKYAAMGRERLIYRVLDTAFNSAAKATTAYSFKKRARKSSNPTKRIAGQVAGKTRAQLPGLGTSLILKRVFPI